MVVHFEAGVLNVWAGSVCDAVVVVVRSLNLQRTGLKMRYHGRDNREALNASLETWELIDRISILLRTYGSELKWSRCLEQLTVLDHCVLLGAENLV